MEYILNGLKYLYDIYFVIRKIKIAIIKLIITKCENN